MNDIHVENKKTEQRELKRKEKKKRAEDEIDTNVYISDNQKAYKVLKYAHNCEEHNQISFVLPLIKSTPKFILFIVLNIFTVGIINLFIAWFPKIVLYIYYKVTTLEESTHFGVFSKDNELLVVEKKVIDLPAIDSTGENNIIKRFNLNINYEEKMVIMFEYKLFDYLFNSKKDAFTTIDYQIKQKRAI